MLAPEQRVGNLRRTRGSERVPLVATAGRPPATRIRFNGRRVLSVVKVGETRVSGAIDIGATRTFISRALANKWRRQVEEAIRLADGTTRIVSEALDLAIELNNQKKTITLLILDEVIRLLGIDLLIHCKATIQGGGIITKIGGKRLRQQRERRTKRRSPYKPMRATAN